MNRRHLLTIAALLLPNVKFGATGETSRFSLASAAEAAAIDPLKAATLKPWLSAFLDAPDLAAALEILGVDRLVIPAAQFDKHADNSAALAAALARGSVNLSNRPLLIQSTVRLGRNQAISGQGPDGALNTLASTGIELAGGSRLVTMTLQGGPDSRALVRDSEGGDNISLLFSDLFGNGRAVHFNQPSATNRRIIGNRISSKNYALLFDEKMVGGSGFVVSSNVLESNRDDGLNFNFPHGAASNIAIVGNVITAGAEGVGPTAGFALALARTNGVAAAGNVYPESRNEAIHIEDSQQGTVMVAGVANMCRADGARILNRSKAEGVDISHHVFRAAERSPKSGVGIYQVWDSNGTIPRSIYIGNRIVGFEVGFKAGASVRTIFDKNIFEDCSVAIDVAEGGSSAPLEIIGENLVKGQVDTLVRSGKGNVTVGKFICETSRPTTIVKKTNANAQPGVTLRGLSFPVNGLSHPGKGTHALFPLLDLPTCLKGTLRLTVGNKNGPHSIWRSSDVSWTDGKLVETNVVSRVTGGIGGATLVAQDKVLTIGITCVPATSLDLWFDFDGAFYVS